MRREKKIRPATVALILFILAIAIYAYCVAAESNKRADQVIAEVDILTDGMGR